MNYANLRDKGDFILRDVHISESENIILFLQLADGPILKVLSENLGNIPDGQINSEANYYDLGIIAVDVEAWLPTETPKVEVTDIDVEPQKDLEEFEPDCLPGEFDCARILVNGYLHMRRKPSARSFALNWIPGGTYVRVIEGTQGPWLRIMYRGKLGYVNGHYVDYDGGRKL